MSSELSVYELEVEYSEVLPEREALGSITGVAASFNANSASFNGSFNDFSTNNGNLNG